MGKTLEYVSEFTFPSSNSKPMTTGYAKGGMAMGGMKSTKPAASPAPKSDMLYSKKENTAKTLLSDGKGAPMPHAKGSVNMAMGGMVMSPAQAATAQALANRQAALAQAPAMPAMAKGGMAKGGMNCGMAKGGKVPEKEFEGSKMDMKQDKKLAAKYGMSMKDYEKSSMDKKHDTQQSMKGMAKGGMSKVGKVMGEYKAGDLHSGSKNGPMVTNRKQAVAIGMSEARKASKK